MKQLCMLIRVIIITFTISTVCSGIEIAGHASGEARLFPHEPILADQRQHNFSVALQPEFTHQHGNWDYTFVPFGRLDSADRERSHLDIREFNAFTSQDLFDFRIGIGKVYWGATEFVHLVDVVNQTDLIEHPDGEEKFGQPMVQLTLQRSFGTFDLFALPFFRERTFAGAKGRLRPERPIAIDDAVYQSPDRKHGVSICARYSNTIAAVDFGLYAFRGDSREPRLIPYTHQGEDIFVPFYEEMTQFGLDLTWAKNACLWKLEGIRRVGYEYTMWATTGGLEYSLFNIHATSTDLGLIAEYAYDERGKASMTPYDNDLMFGLRVTPNDSADSQLLLGLTHDLDNSNHIYILETSRRIKDNWRLTAEAWIFSNLNPNSIYYGLRDDDFLRIQLSRFF
jgi:hypothetical protein